MDETNIVGAMVWALLAMWAWGNALVLGWPAMFPQGRCAKLMYGKKWALFSHPPHKAWIRTAMLSIASSLGFFGGWFFQMFLRELFPDMGATLLPWSWGMLGAAACVVVVFFVWLWSHPAPQTDIAE